MGCGLFSEDVAALAAPGFSRRASQGLGHDENDGKTTGNGCFMWGGRWRKGVSCRAIVLFCPAGAEGFVRSRQLAQSLRPVSVMTAIRSAILFVFNVLNERRERVAGQEVRAAGQDLPGGQGEDCPCR
ncbi:hypothetical protein [Brevundimonas sp.]|uniref:hypothetical protein n=1 Tax=Brevundimonas sp. TaxID=1871086 RepID=UPI0025C2CD51|nr:hypothetical protein [Brevundimonas sp.]